MDKIVFDIETKNSFADVGGQGNLKKLDASFVGVYSYNQNKYLSFFENQFAELGELLKKTGLLIGFSSKRFDIPVLEKYFKFDINKIHHVDLLEEVELNFGRRISLDILAKTNLGIGKTNHGLEAIKFYKEGDLASLEKYCINDVKITKELYELAKKQGHLMIPERTTGELVKVSLDWQEIFLPPTLF